MATLQTDLARAIGSTAFLAAVTDTNADRFVYTANTVRYLWLLACCVRFECDSVPVEQLLCPLFGETRPSGEHWDRKVEGFICRDGFVHDDR